VQALGIVTHAQNVFERLEQVRPSKSSIFGRIVGHLLAKSAHIETELALAAQNADEQVLAALQVYIR